MEQRRSKPFISQKFLSDCKLESLSRLLIAFGCVTALTGCFSQTRNTTPTISPISPSPVTSPIPVVPSPTASPSTEAAKPEAVKTIESKLQRMVSEAGVPVQAIDCPANAELKPGKQFDCEATADGKPFAIAVTLTNEANQFQWSTKELLLLSKLEQFIQKQLKDKSGVDVTADCGGKVRVAQPGDTFECQVKAQGQARSMRVTVKDEQGSVDITLL